MPDLDDKFKSRVSFTLLAITAIALSLGLIWIGRVIFLLLFASIVGSVLLTTVASWIHAKFKIKEGIALSLFLVLSLAVVALLIWIQGPNAADQFAALEVELPKAAQSLLMQLQSHQWGQWLLQQSPGSDQISSGFSFALTHIGGIVVSSATILAGLVIVLSLSIYFSSEPGMYYNGLRRVIPEEHRETLDACAASVAEILRWWGPRQAHLHEHGRHPHHHHRPHDRRCAPRRQPRHHRRSDDLHPQRRPADLSRSRPPAGTGHQSTTGLLTLLVFAIVFTLEGYVVTPLLERNIVRLPPALTLVMQLLLAAIAGPVGVALAAPLAAAILGILSVVLPKAPAVTVPRPRRERITPPPRCLMILRQSFCPRE